MHSDDTLHTGSLDRWECMPLDELCRYSRPVLRSIVEARLDERLMQRVDASDVVQETLLEIMQRIEDFKRRQPMPIWNWMRETALQQLRIAIRKHQTAERRTILKQVSSDRSSVFRLVEEISAVMSVSEKQVEAAEQAERTRQALGRLSHLDREILMLRYLNGFSNQEVARILDITTTSASKRHCRALLRLQKQLSGNDGQKDRGFEP